MPTATLDDFMAFNDQLAALHGAGVPLDLGLGRGGEDVMANLVRINSVVARRVSQGESLVGALEVDDPAMPLAYRSLVQVGLQSGDWVKTLDGYRHLTQRVGRSWNAVTLGLLYPLVVCGLAYLGFIGFCLYLFPTLESLYDSLRLQPESGLRLVHAVRATLPYWSVIPVVGLLGYFGWRMRIQAARAQGRFPEVRSWARLPGMPHALHLQRCANFADTLATLADSGMSLATGVRLAGGACGDASLGNAAKVVANSLEDGRIIDVDSATAREFPPFLRWALWRAPATMSSSRALRMAASFYRDAADRRMERLSGVAPLVACAVIGGSATLLYGLALFVPVVQMLIQLAS